MVIDDDEDEEEKENTLAVSLLHTEVEDAAAVYNKQQVDICDKQQKDTADVCSVEKTVDSVDLESKRLNKMSSSHTGLDSDDDVDENFAHSDDHDDHDDDTAATEQEERVILQEPSAAQDVTPRQRFDLNSDIFDTESCDSYPGETHDEVIRYCASKEPLLLGSDNGSLLLWLSSSFRCMHTYTKDEAIAVTSFM